jgi:hypothetical protein
MSDFDITTFRSKSKKTGKKPRRRDPTSVTTSFTKYLEKRASTSDTWDVFGNVNRNLTFALIGKELGLDDSDEDTNEVDVKRKSQKTSETSHPSKLESPENSQPSWEIAARSEEAVESTVVTATVSTSVETEKSTV